MIMLIIWLIVICLVLWLAYYIINNLAPEPFRRVLNVILIVISVLVLIMFLLNYAGPMLASGGGLGGSLRPCR